jgi:hypothetical protein
MTQRLHSPILAETAKSAQLPGRGFFRERNPCKHWSKCVSSTLMSSMFLKRGSKKRAFSARVGRIFCPFRFAPSEQFSAAFQLRHVLLFLSAQAGEIFCDVVAVFRRDAMPHHPDFLDGFVCRIHITHFTQAVPASGPVAWRLPLFPARRSGFVWPSRLAD